MAFPKESIHLNPFILETMTCYFRHMKPVFEEAKIEVTAENKREVDRVIHSIVSVDYRNCSTTWKEVKAHLERDRSAFVEELKARYSR